MPSTSIVPSKRVLRALRNVALGTSCTAVAIGVGVVAEERRRLLHSVQRINENTKKLKASRKYHSAGSEAVAQVADQIFANGYDSADESLRLRVRRRAAKLNADNNTLSLDTSIVRSNAEAESPENQLGRLHGQGNEQDSTESWPGTREQSENEGSSRPRWDKADDEPTNAQRRRLNDAIKNANKPISDANASRWMRLRQQAENLQSNEPFGTREEADIRGDDQILFEFEQGNRGSAKKSNSARRLPADNWVEEVSTCLNSAADAEQVARVAETFFRAIKQNAKYDSTGSLDVALRLSLACQEVKDFETAAAILCSVAASKRADDLLLLDFKPAEIIRGLLSQRPRYEHAAVSHLHEVIDMYLEKFGIKSHQSPEMTSVGLLLIDKAMEYHLFKRVEPLYRRYLAFRVKSLNALSQEVEYENDSTHRAIGHLLQADAKLRQPDKILDHFFLYYNNMAPSQSQLDEIMNVVLKAALVRRNWAQAENALERANRAAREGGAEVRAEWFTMLLEANWEVYKHPAKLQHFYANLVSYAEVSSQREAIDACISQILSEIPEESLSATAESTSTRSLKDEAYLVLSKARDGEWQQVDEDLYQFCGSRSSSPKQFQAIFLDLLKAHAQTHAFSDTRLFLDHCVRNYGMRITPVIREFMARFSANVKGFSFSSVLEWIQQELGLDERPTCDSVNRLLSQCYSFGMHFDRLMKICTTIRKHDRSLINDDTLALLQGAAFKTARGRHDDLRIYLRVIARKFGTIEDHKTVQMSMMHAMSRGDRVDALRIYIDAVENGRVITAGAIRSAVQISLHLNGVEDLAPTLRLLSDARDKGYDIRAGMSSLYIYLVDRAGRNAEKILDIYANLVKETQAYGWNLPIDVITHTIRQLIACNKFSKAIEVWQEACQVDETLAGKTDHVLLTTLLQAFSMLKDADGITWAVEKILEQNHVPDYKVKRTLQDALKMHTENLVYRPGSARLEELVQLLSDHLDTVMEVRHSVFSREAEMSVVDAIKQHRAAKGLVAV